MKATNWLQKKTVQNLLVKTKSELHNRRPDPQGYTVTLGPPHQTVNTRRVLFSGVWFLCDPSNCM